MMNNSYGNLDSALNIESKFSQVEKVPEELEILPMKVEDIQKDYEYTRANLYSLIEKGQEAINGAMEIANDGGSARAYEVAGQLIKSVGDVTDKLLDLQKKIKDIESDKIKTTTNTMNNAIFVGSTSELSKLLKQGFLNNKE